MKPKARPRPKEARTEEDNNKEEPKKREAEEGGDDTQAPNNMVVLAKNRWGKLGEEKRKRDISKAPWTKSGRRGTTDKTSENE